MAQEIVQGSQETLVFGPMVLAVDRQTTATGLTFSVLQASVNTAPFATIPTVQEIGQGMYRVPAGAFANYPTIGPIIVHAEAPGADPFDGRIEVVPYPGARPLRQGSTTYPLTFLLTSDGLAGLPSLMPVATLAKAGGAFAPAVGATAEIGGAGHGYGNYYLPADPANYDTPGSLILRATAPGAIGFDFGFAVALAAGQVPPVATLDPSFAVGLNAVVAIEVDVNAAGQASGLSGEGGYQPSYQGVAGLAAVPCRIVERRSKTAEEDRKLKIIGRQRVLFGPGIYLDTRNRLVLLDPLRGGARRTLYVDGQSRDAHQMGHHVAVDTFESPF